MRCAIGLHAWGHQYDAGMLRERERNPGACAIAYYPCWARVCSRCGSVQYQAHEPWPRLQIVEPKVNK